MSFKEQMELVERERKARIQGVVDEWRSGLKEKRQRLRQEQGGTDG